MSALAQLRTSITSNEAWELLDASENAVTDLESSTKIRFPSTNSTFALQDKVWRDYSLADILHYYQNRHVDYRTYFSAVLARGLNQISMVDTQPLQRFLAGEAESLPNEGAGR